MKRMKKGAFALLLTLCVTLGLLPALTVTANAAGYSVTVGSTTNGSVTADKTSASQGETVTLTVTPNGGFVLDALTIDGGSVTPVLKSSPTSFYGSSEWTFTMPDKNVTVSATFKIGIPRGITKDITGQGTGYSDCVRVWHGKQHASRLRRRCHADRHAE